jgi:hypothetical protein
VQETEQKRSFARYAPFGMTEKNGTKKEEPSARLPLGVKRDPSLAMLRSG